MVKDIMSIRKKKYECEIVNVEKDPRHPGRTLVSLKIFDGKNPAWMRAYSIITPVTPLSIEEFIEHAKEIGLDKPRDPLQELKDAEKSSQKIEVEA